MGLRRLAAACLVAGSLLGPGLPVSGQERVAIWAGRGSHPAVDAALAGIVERFEKRFGVKVDLTLVPAGELAPRVSAALAAGTPPDGAFGRNLDLQAAAWAAAGKIEDVSDLVLPQRERLFETALAAATYVTAPGRRGIFGIPIQQQALHLNYWSDMLAEVGIAETDIPADWSAYWAFWCDRVQPALRAKGRRVYSVGLASGSDSTAALLGFLAFAQAHDALPLDREGRLLLADPRLRAGLIAAVREYADLTAKGCTPPGALVWGGEDAAASFRSRTAGMAANAGLAVAAGLFEAAASGSDSAARAAARRAHDDLVRTIGLPAPVNGKPAPVIVSVQQGAVFAEAPARKRARDFFAFFLLPENLTPYVEAARGIWFPVTRDAAERSFWQDDPHRRAAHQTFTQRATQPLPMAQHFRFAALHAENSWARLLRRVVMDRVTPEQAVDDLLAQIRQRIDG